ncbi:MAG: tRNA 2-thiouridine(34) synthase MnmA [Bacteroidales bacterium]|jgi:tRNA-specific 2-thiouridylase|nr:tRNA 2-thiouridine(34) synthase MnmA [Bacteroidales bacterium]
MPTTKRVLLAMSGGLDSSMCAVLLQQRGYQVIGITMKLWEYPQTCSSARSACCDIDAINDARQLAVKLNIPHYVLDYTKEFKDLVINNFVDEYLHARTPNPCIRCNIFLKWKALLEKAKQLQCDYIATGHYAQIGTHNGRYYIRKGKDAQKDQSYVLWGLSQTDLAQTLFPLGEYLKEDVRQMASELGFQQLASKRESYDICFIPDNNYSQFLETQSYGLQEQYKNGNVLDTEGNIIGKHKGFPFYTIGQRKGLNLAFGVPKYVCKISAQKNEITLGDKSDLLSNSLIIKDINLLKYEQLPSPFEGVVKIRYRDKGEWAKITQESDYLIVKFKNPVSAITPGQSAVIYEENDVVGGGIIELL